MGSKFEEEFLNYFKKTIPLDEEFRFYRLNDVEEPKLLLVRDIITSLFHIISNTYLGDDFMSHGDKENHFQWCWNHLSDKLSDVNITLNNKLLFKDWVKLNAYEYFYDALDKDRDNQLNTMIDFWTTTLEIGPPKTKSNMDLLIEAYNFYYKSVE